jgi:hypothetical protein
MMRKLLLLVATSVILALISVACSDDDEGEEEPGTPPPATVRVSDGKTVEAGTGSSCWGEPASTGLCIDKIGIITNAEIATIDAGAALRLSNGLEGADIDSVTVSVFSAEGDPSQLDDSEIAWPFPANPGAELQAEVTDDGVSFIADLEPGRWLISVFLKVPQGDVMYGLFVEVSDEGGTSSGVGPGISVAEALASDLDGPLLVNGFLVIRGGESDDPEVVRLCEALAEAYPPQCGGASLIVEGLGLKSIDGIVSEGPISWTEQYVQVLGTVSGEVLTVNSTSQ